MGDKNLMNLQCRNTTDFKEIAPPGCLVNRDKPRWGSQTIYKNDFGPLRILKLQNLEYSGGVKRSIPRIRSFSDS